MKSGVIADRGRRRLLQLSGPALLSAAALGRGRPAEAAVTGEPTYYIEICLRDQFDFGHIYVPPGLATAVDLKRGEKGRMAALFYQMNELTQMPNDVYLTPESLLLKPHVDTVAMVEICELTDGPVHGHEAANGVRSPGRSRTRSPGKIAMWDGEPGRNNGEGAFYSSTPTPMALHNYWQRQLSPALRNGVVIKGQSRAFGMYHFGAGLPGAEPDRFQTVTSLLDAFPAGGRINVTGTPREADAILRLLGRADARHLKSRGFSRDVQADHDSQLKEARSVLHGEATANFDLNLTADEKAYWSTGVRPKYGRTTIDLWQQAAYAVKLLTSGLVRSMALEIDIGDVHGQRTVTGMRDQNVLVATTVARLIEKLKEARLYDRTLIAVFTLDGGRSPAAASSGDEGKNGALLAGGMIRGGYYGDVRTAGPDRDGQKYSYHMPDLVTGRPIPDGTLKNDKRLPGKALWRSVAAALKIPESTAGRFPDVADAKPLPWLLRS